MSETKEQTKPPTFEELKRFEFIKVLNTRTKKINLLGYLSTPPSSSSDDPTLQKHHAILLVEKSHFDNKELSNFTSQRINDWMLKDKNDIYHWYDGLLNKDEKLPDINMTLIWPATETPYIDSIPSSRIQWVYNILQKKSEAEKILMEDPNYQIGFVLLPDMKWDNKTLESLYLVAIVHRNDIHSLRDLNKSHIPLLKNLRKKILEFVPKKFVGVGADELRLFVHYLPSYYHFHIHITHLSSDTIPDGIAIGKAYLLDDIITNLELFSDEYYQKTILTYVIGENDLLFSKLNDVGARDVCDMGDYEGHSWLARIDQIQRGTWCPYCKNKQEQLCCEIATKYLGLPSKIHQPDFLKTLKYPTGLHLDIYYPEFGLAIEVQGQQHEKYIEFFHRDDPNNFIKQQEQDQLKKELCKENWIVLRYVWYYEDPYIVIPEHLHELGLIE
nr:13253_t:CDS:2 [Entrophospora candida]